MGTCLKFPTTRKKIYSFVSRFISHDYQRNKEMRLEVGLLESNNYLDDATRAITISFLLYELNLNYFVQFTQVNSISGHYEPD